MTFPWETSSTGVKRASCLWYLVNLVHAKEHAFPASGSLATETQGFHVTCWESFVLRGLEIIFFKLFSLCRRSNHSVNSDCTSRSTKEYGSHYQRTLLIITLGFAVSFFFFSFFNIKWLYIKYFSHQAGLTAFALRKSSFFPFYDPFFFLFFFFLSIHITFTTQGTFVSAGSYTFKLLSSRPVSVREKATKQRNVVKRE